MKLKDWESIIFLDLFQEKADLYRRLLFKQKSDV